MEKIKVGDYVEVLGGDSADVVTGEQGIVIDDIYQDSIQVIFPARKDYWGENGWCVMARQVKLLYRPRIK